LDKKIFTIKEQYNHQNNKIYVQMSHEVRKTFQGCKQAITCVCHGLVGGVPPGGNTSSFLRERGETGAQVYQEDMLQGAVKQLKVTLFRGQEWVLQQNSASAHKAKTT
jgi:hypothetical protein